MSISGYIEQPIRFAYPKVDSELINKLQSEQQIVEISQGPRIKVTNAYYQRGLAGTHIKVLTRRSIVIRLEKLLTLLPADTGIYVFDAFRSIKTQEAIYQEFKDWVREHNPNFTPEEIEERTLQFVSHPHNTERFAVPLHNSGGAIDLGLFDLKTGENWDFGTHIDDITDLSYTDYFEQAYRPGSTISEANWYHIRHNRRILYHAMVELGFVNFSNEWWHYDLGDCHWSAIHNCAPLYPSMEKQSREFLA